MEKEGLLFSSKAGDKTVQVYDHNDEKYIQAERLAARIMIDTRNQRLNIRDYNQRFNNPNKRVTSLS